MNELFAEPSDGVSWLALYQEKLTGVAGPAFADLNRRADIYVVDHKRKAVQEACEQATVTVIFKHDVVQFDLRMKAGGRCFIRDQRVWLPALEASKVHERDRYAVYGLQVIRLRAEADAFNKAAIALDDNAAALEGQIESAAAMHSDGLWRTLKGRQQGLRDAAAGLRTCAQSAVAAADAEAGKMEML